jgi:hypothetical protein
MIVLFWSACTGFTAFVYEFGNNQSIFQWKIWPAAVEMTSLMTCLNILLWIVSLLVIKIFKHAFLLYIAVLFVLIAIINYSFVYYALAIRSPLIVMFGSDTPQLFDDDVYIVYLMLITPVISIVSCALYFLWLRFND